MKRNIFLLTLSLFIANAASAQMSVNNAQNNLLVRFHDEGTSGSIFLTSGPSPNSVLYKLYNNSGELYWNGDLVKDNLGNAIADRIVQLKGNWLSYDTTPKGVFISDEYKVGIGNINDPETTLHVWGDPGNMLHTRDGIFIGRGNGGGARIKIAEHTTPSPRAPKLDFAVGNSDFDGRIHYHTTLGFTTHSKRDHIMRFTNEDLADDPQNIAGNYGLSIRYSDGTGPYNAVLDNEADGGILFFSGGEEMARVQDNGTFRPRENPVGAYQPDLGRADKRWGTVYAVNGFDQLSDLRAKSNIQDIGYGLQEIMRLRPVSYAYKNQERNDKKLGLIAQEVQTVVSEAVSVGDDPEKMLGMDYTKLIPVLIKAIQEQQVEIEALKKALNR